MVAVKRDWLPPATALLLGLLALPATGWLHVRPMPTSLSALARVAACALSLMLLAAALKGPRGLGVGRPLSVALAAAPFLVLVLLSGVPGLAATVPWRGLALLLVICLVTVTAESELARRSVVGAVGSYLLLALFAPTVGVGPLLPAAWNPLAAVERQSQRESIGPPEKVPGIRADVAASPRPTHPLGAEDGPWYRAVNLVEDRIVFPFVGTLGTVEAPSTNEATFRAVSEEALGHVFDLDAYDALVVAPDALEGLPLAKRRGAARAVARFVRGGGLLLGLGPGGGWPPDLALALGAAGKSTVNGYDGRRHLGIGMVVHAGEPGDVSRLLGMDLWVPPVQTVFRRAGVPPPPPAGFLRWEDEPRGRRPVGALLLAAGLLLLLLVWVARTPVAALGLVLVWAVGVSAGLWLVAPRDPGFVTRGAVLELGGAGGRRTEVLWLAAGPGGYEGHIKWFQGAFERTRPGQVGRPETGGFARILGARLGESGRVVVSPGQGAWILRERVSPGEGAPTPPEGADAGLRELLRGRIDSKQVSRGRMERLPVAVEGAGPIPAGILRVRSP